LVEFTGERVVPGQVNADLWNEHFSRYAYARRFASGRRVLDAGCGTGYGTAELARDAAVVAGVDIDPQTIAWARQTYPLDNVRWMVASGMALPFAAGAFDAVISFEVIEHLADQRGFLRECSRVLTAGGLLVVSTPNKLYYGESRGEAGLNPYHVRELDAQEFASELREVFPNVAVTVQNRFECFGIYPAKGVSAVEARMDGTGGALEDANFFIGVCSREELPPSVSFIYVPRAANLLREREQHISKLEKWLAEVRAELDAAQKRIPELQQELAEEQAAAQKHVSELETENLTKTKWAEDVQKQLDSCAALLTIAENTVVERSAWAQRLDAQVLDLQQQLGAVAASRWHRAGRKLGVGPVIPLFEKPAG
jgi:SAM-dependent methyltransferase